jgi:hypothetical protein
MELEKIKCSRCQEDMPKLRLTIYGYDFCVNCSDVKPKVGRIRVIGEGDYTVTELDVLDQDVARKLQEMENTSRGIKNNPLEVLDFDEDEASDDLKTLEIVTEQALTVDVDEPEFIELPELGDDDEELEDISDKDSIELNEDDED